MNFPTTVSFLVLAALGACAPKVPQELLDAREAFRATSSSQAESIVPTEYGEAELALERAEAAFLENPSGYEVADLAYVAQRKAQLADAMVAVASASEAAAVARVEYETTLAKLTAEAQRRKDQMAADATLGDDARMREAIARMPGVAQAVAEARGLVVVMPADMIFRVDDAVLLRDARRRLDDVAQVLMTVAGRNVLIESHSDDQGTDAYNIELTQQQADAVRQFLVDEGYDAARIRAVGVGGARPAASNATPEGRASNRRLEIVLQAKPTATSSQ